MAAAKIITNEINSREKLNKADSYLQKKKKKENFIKIPKSLCKLAPKRVSHLIHIFKMQPINTFEVMRWLLLGIEPKESSSWRAAWVSLSAVQHCAYSCSNRVQVCVDAHAMAVHEVAGGALEHRRPWSLRFQSTYTPLEVHS
jgi:hypothetical protein